MDINSDDGGSYEATVLQFVHPQNVERFPEGKELTGQGRPGRSEQRRAVGLSHGRCRARTSDLSLVRRALSQLS